VNGILKVYKNGNFTKQIDASNRKDGWSDGMDAGPNSIQIDLYPVDPAKPSKAVIWLQAYKIDKHFEHCLDAKNCLGLMGDGTAAGFELGNVNAEQLKCLEGYPTAKLKRKCNQWLKCLRGSEANMRRSSKRLSESNMKIAILKSELDLFTEAEKLTEFLKAFLRAAGVNMAMSMSGETGESLTCVDPAIEDPEAWECNCMQEMIDACNGIDETCFANRMCGRSDVCAHWKKANCMCCTRDRGNECTMWQATHELCEEASSSVSLPNTQTQQISLLDDTLTGKCGG